MTRAFLTIVYKLPHATAAKSIPAIQNQVCRILSFLSLGGPIYGPSSECTVFFHGPQCQTCSMRFYTITLKAEMSIHQELVTKCKMTVLKTESSINGFPSCQKIKNASLSDPKDSSHISTSMASFFLWVYHMMLFQPLALRFGVRMVNSAFITSHVFNTKSSPQQRIFQDTVQAS